MRIPLWVQILSFSCSFQKFFDQIIGWRPHLGGWRPLLWEILDPSLVSSRNKLQHGSILESWTRDPWIEPNWKSLFAITTNECLWCNITNLVQRIRTRCDILLLPGLLFLIRIKIGTKAAANSYSPRNTSTCAPTLKIHRLPLPACDERLCLDDNLQTSSTFTHRGVSVAL